MVPFDAFCTDAPQSSSAFCSGWLGGTQWASFNSNVLSLSWAKVDAAPTINASPAAVAISAPRCECGHKGIESSLWSGRRRSVTACQLWRDSASSPKACKEIVGYKTISLLGFWRYAMYVSAAPRSVACPVAETCLPRKTKVDNDTDEVIAPIRYGPLEHWVGFNLR